ncbi:hypothetical protein [Vibrio crassostreae]|uniref:hypothetical protein n=1 Tax=Vibrio crassostreae TaxID=246167 RepID=UPI001B3051E2|nr:hypothetical protein [Vibrio crassostreae]
MLFRIKPTAQFQGEDVFLKASQSSSTIDAVIFDLTSDWKAEIQRRFSGGNFLLSTKEVELVESLIENKYTSLAVDATGFYTLAAKKGDNWKLNVIHSPLDIESFDEEKGLANVTQTTFTPARQVDTNILSAIYAQAGLEFIGSLTGSVKPLQVVVRVLGLYIDGYQSNELPEETEAREKKEKEQQQSCIAEIKAHLSENNLTIDDLVLDNDWEEPFGGMINIKLSNSEFCNILKDKYSYFVLEEAINNL